MQRNNYGRKVVGRERMDMSERGRRRRGEANSEE